MLGRELFARPLLFTNTPRFIVMIWSSSSSQPLRAPCAWCAVWLHGYMCVCVCVNNINWLVIILHRVCVCLFHLKSERLSAHARNQSAKQITRIRAAARANSFHRFTWINMVMYYLVNKRNLPVLATGFASTCTRARGQNRYRVESSCG